MFRMALQQPTTILNPQIIIDQGMQSQTAFADMLGQFATEIGIQEHPARMVRIGSQGILRTRYVDDPDSARQMLAEYKNTSTGFLRKFRHEGFTKDLHLMSLLRRRSKQPDVRCPDYAQGAIARAYALSREARGMLRFKNHDANVEQEKSELIEARAKFKRAAKQFDTAAKLLYEANPTDYKIVLCQEQALVNEKEAIKLYKKLYPDSADKIQRLSEYVVEKAAFVSAEWLNAMKKNDEMSALLAHPIALTHAMTHDTRDYCAAPKMLEMSAMYFMQKGERQLAFGDMLRATIQLARNYGVNTYPLINTGSLSHLLRNTLMFGELAELDVNVLMNIQLFVTACDVRRPLGSDERRLHDFIMCGNTQE